MTRRVLVISPHTDDGELGCGGTIARFIREGDEVQYVALSSTDKSLPGNCPKDILVSEVNHATATLGLPKPILFEFDVREFPRQRQEILDALIGLRSRLAPDFILTPSSFDTHQDHRTVREETLRAFKNTTILGYEQPWNNVTFNTLAFVTLMEEDIKKKLAALTCYRTQRKRPYLNPDFITGMARMRGVQVEVEYAEAFEVIKWVMR
jgi:LmbE family N-acetylglucosaminyl deacetylase